jgi:hypothetical protein
MSSDKLSRIIARTNKAPTIVNEQSKFVVTTYWWGRGNLNQNTARPCVFFYEDFIKKVVKFFINLINTTVKSSSKKGQIPLLIQKIFDSYKTGKKLFTYNQMVSKIAFNYINSVYEYCKIDIHSKNKDEEAIIFLEKLKTSGKTPNDYEYKNEEYVKNILEFIIKYIVTLNEDVIVQLFLTNDAVSDLKKKFTEIQQRSDQNQESEYARIKRQLRDYEKKKREYNNKITANLKKKIEVHPADSGFSDAKYNNTNVYDILNMEFRYLEAIQFEEMIDQWESACRKFHCNFLSVEYPEFAQPGGYQLAINAKPLFIQKALELCPDRGVLYIDGDMYIRKYTNIFDMPDVDFMARGWWIDPRSSHKMTESIMYDPYTFETSGGTMFFAQTNESKKLIEVWINESAKPYNAGKADDRILSLVFNTNKFLCNMKIIQLPIEYLWLTLGYDERLLEELYDYNDTKMRQTIFIEHPECLTSEESATGAGASGDRTPKFYSFLEELTPTSEMLHEYIFFPNKEMTSAFKDYFDFMNDTTYIDDGNEDLIKNQYVDPEDPFNNEQPLYIVKYDDRFGNKPHSSGEKDDTGKMLSVNEIVDINMKAANSMNIDSLSLENVGENMVEIKNADNSIDNAKMIRLIIKLLHQNKTVIYNPVSNDGYHAKYYNTLMSNIDIYKSLEFVFVPQIESFTFSKFFKPKIQTNQAMLFCPGNEILMKFLSMFLSLDELSDHFNYGPYEFMSRIRVGYLFAKKLKTPVSAGGGNTHKTAKSANSANSANSAKTAKTAKSIKSVNSMTNKFIDEYNNGLITMYPLEKSTMKKMSPLKSSMKKMSPLKSGLKKMSPLKKSGLKTNVEKSDLEKSGGKNKNRKTRHKYAKRKNKVTRRVK